jgi:hypothetical protein
MGFEDIVDVYRPALENGTAADGISGDPRINGRCRNR